MAAAAAAVIATTGKENTPKVQVCRPQLGSITRSASAFGRIRAVEQVKISPDVSGEITDLLFAEGDTVHKGDLLLKIKQESYLMTIERCNASLGSAMMALEACKGETRLKELEYGRLCRLNESDAATGSELQQALAALECARARERECEYRIAAERASLNAARSELGKTLVYSPMDGIVTSLRVKTGERVVGTSTMAGTEIMTIADIGRLELVVQIGENDICSVKNGDRAEIRPDASPSDLLKGRVEKIAVCASTGRDMGSTTDFEVRISIDNQDIVRLLPGMSASATIITGTKNDILTVPLQSVMVRDGHETVWIVDSLRRVRSVPVRCGIQDFSRVEICSGLTERDLVVTGPFGAINGTLSEGDKVKTEL